MKKRLILVLGVGILLILLLTIAFGERFQVEKEDDLQQETSSNSSMSGEKQQVVKEGFSNQQMQGTLPSSEVEQIFQRKGSLQGEVFKLTFPRTDLNVKVRDVIIEPELALSSWVAFKPMGDKTMMMGDLVLLEKELDPVTAKLTASGVEITALHNHLINEFPRIIYTHFSGHGDATKLSGALKEALSLTGTPIPATEPASSSEKVDWSKIESLIGRLGNHNNNILQFSIPRAETITDHKLDVHGIEIPPSMGTATAINFQMVEKKVVSTGDFVLIDKEIDSVTRILKEKRITVTALHNHMTYDNPRLFFLHFWAYDEPEVVAKALKSALNKTNSK